MAKSSKFISDVNGGLFRRFIADKLHFLEIDPKDLKKLTDKAATKLDNVPKKLRPKRARRKYLGPNPSRSTAEGRKLEKQILERMEREGKARKVKKLNGKEEWQVKNPAYDPTSPDSNFSSEWVNSKNCDFGHHPVDAVDFWNNEGRFYGARSQHVRDWMNNPDNYEMQPKWYNQAEGRDLGNSGARYQPEATGVNPDTLDKIFGDGNRKIRPNTTPTGATSTPNLSPFDDYRPNQHKP